MVWEPEAFTYPRYRPTRIVSAPDATYVEKPPIVVSAQTATMNQYDFVPEVVVVVAPDTGLNASPVPSLVDPTGPVAPTGPVGPTAP